MESKSCFDYVEHEICICDGLAGIVCSGVVGCFE